MSGSASHHPLPVAARPPVFSRTKFLAPQPRSTQVSRSAHVQRLVDADHLPLTIVVGAPGSGKTSLLAEWYRHRDDGTIAWLVSDRGDDDPTRFWRGVIRAVQQVTPGFGVAATDMITLDGVVGDDALESLLDDDAALDDRIRLVIDDFHLVGHRAAQQLQHLLTRGLANLRLLIGSRSDPAVGLHRLRLEQAVCEVREADLRLDLAETRELLANIGIDPDQVDVQALHHRTEGWAAGVQMAAVSVVGSDDPAARIRELAGTTQTVAGYLITEVVTHQPDHVRAFLEDTCVVDELDAAMCEALTDASGPNGRVTLGDVESAHLLLNRVDSAGTVFRYHHLFGELLRHGLLAREPERFRLQHCKAAEHFVRVGDIGAAVRHYWYGGRADLGAHLMRTNLLDAYLTAGTPPPMDPNIVPNDEALAASPGDAVGYAVGLLLNGQIQASAALIRRADALARTSEVDVVDRLQIIGTRIATEIACGDAPAAIELTREFIVLMDGADLGDGQWAGTSIALGARACILQGELAFADTLLDYPVLGPDPRAITVDVAGTRAALELESGRIGAAIERSAGAVDAAGVLGVVGSGPELAARSVLASALLDAGRLGEASTELAAANQAIRVERVPAYVTCTIANARLMRAHGDFDGARRAYGEARDHLRIVSPGPTLGARLDTAAIALHLALGDLEVARQLHAGLPPGFRTSLTAGWMAELRQEWAVVDSIVDELSSMATSLRQRFDLSLLQLRAAIDQALGSDAVNGMAEHTLSLAHEAGFVLPIAEAGSSVLQAVTAAAKRRPRDQFIEALLLAQPLPRPADQARPEYRVDELSSRELIVLRYMATSMTNQEIADALYLSVNTVKTHIKHVLRKLGATSRAEATRRAQELHYL